MRFTVRKSRCWLCGDSYNPSWIVSDSDGHFRYATPTWREAFDYAYGATQPGTGVLVHTEKKKVSNA